MRKGPQQLARGLTAEQLGRVVHIKSAAQNEEFVVARFNVAALLMITYRNRTLLYWPPFWYLPLQLAEYLC